MDNAITRKNEEYGKYEFRKIQGLIGETSFSIILPKQFAINLGLSKGEFVKVYQCEDSIIITKA